jgi:hypothetical protein
VVHEVREDEVIRLVQPAWPEAAWWRQRRAAELLGGGGENREKKNDSLDAAIYVGSGRGYSAGLLASSRWRSRPCAKAVEGHGDDRPAPIPAGGRR